MKYILAGLLFCCCVFPVVSQERILEFNSAIVVNLDRSIDVTEIIKVKAEGNSIKRGIFREIPTVMTGKNSRLQKNTLVINEVLKDGVEENYSTSSIDNGISIRIGNADIFLVEGEYTYTIKYNINRQVRFSDTYDELYWNVTGNFWQFVIENASVTITLPEGAVISQSSGYSGESGNTGCDCSSTRLADNQIKYFMTSPLGWNQGLTVAVGWNKGVIPPPTEEELNEEMINDHMGIVFGLLGLAITSIYLFIVWFRIGRDPLGGPIIPLFNAPKGFSPAASRFVMSMGYDAKTFTASIVNMAMKGFLKIDKSGKYFSLTKQSKEVANLSGEEKKIADKLFSSAQTVRLDNSYDSSLDKAKTEHENQLGNEFKKISFRLNYGWMVPSILLGIATIVVMLSQIVDDDDLAASVIFISMIMIFLLGVGTTSIKNILKQGVWNKVKGILQFIPVGGIISIIIFYIQVSNTSLESIIVVGPYIGIVLSLFFIIVIFFYLIKAPTVFGRRRMDEMEGLKLYMQVAEKNRFNALNPPEMTPKLFEKLLPYAIALDIELEWANQFNDIIANAIAKKEYNPTWYSGPSDSMFEVSKISSSLGSSLSSSISSGSTPPSSDSSGSGGGGSSGGGGGGGGGGGW